MSDLGHVANNILNGVSLTEFGNLFASQSDLLFFHSCMTEFPRIGREYNVYLKIFVYQEGAINLGTVV